MCAVWVIKGKINDSGTEQSRSQSLQAFLSAVGHLERLGKSNKIYIFFSDWLFRVMTYCFAPEIVAHFHSIVPESLQATNC